MPRPSLSMRLREAADLLAEAAIELEELEFQVTELEGENKALVQLLKDKEIRE